MQIRRLGRTGISVSGLCLGTMSFGREADEGEAARIYGACRDAGITFFDCADIYAGGRAEEILGRLVGAGRDEVVLTSKVGMGSTANQGGLSPRHIRLSVERSLRRLATDRLDVLFVHRWDETVPVEETLRALEDLVRAGKALHLGVSNWAAWQIATALGTTDRMGWSGFDVMQPMYSLVKRQAEVELLPLALHRDIAVIPYGPAGGGLLSGKYRDTAATGRLRDLKHYADRYGEAWMFETAARFAALAETMGHHPMTLAVAWVAAHPAVTAPIIGARTVEQIMPSLAALEVEMTPELHAEIAALSRRPPPATDRLEEYA